MEPALDLVFSRELQAGAVAGDQPVHGILGAINAGGKPTARATERRRTGSRFDEWAARIAMCTRAPSDGRQVSWPTLVDASGVIGPMSKPEGQEREKKKKEKLN